MKKIIAMVAMALIAGAASADVIAAWDLWQTTQTNTTTLTATEKDANITVLPVISRGAGIGNPLGTQTNIWAGARDLNAADLAGAIAGNDYIEWSVNVASGYEMDINDISINMVKGEAINTWQAYLFSSVGGYTSGNELGSVIVSSTTRGTPTLLSVNPGFADLTGTTTFRLYMFGASAVSRVMSFGDQNTQGVDAFSMSGTVTAVPEPATVGMLGLGALVTLLIRRMRA